jgi:hypothetical protein
MSCTSPWDYEKLVGAGWTYNQPTLAYNSTEFDTQDVYYDSLALNTVWDTQTAPAIALYEYETKVSGGYEYNLDGLTYDSPLFDTFKVFYNSLGQDTPWFYEDFIDYCTPVVFQFMNGDTYQFQNGDTFDFN